MLIRTYSTNVLESMRNYSPQQAGRDALSCLEQKVADSEEDEGELSPPLESEEEGDDIDELDD